MFICDFINHNCLLLNLGCNSCKKDKIVSLRWACRRKCELCKYFICDFCFDYNYRYMNICTYCDKIVCQDCTWCITPNHSCTKCFICDDCREKCRKCSTILCKHTAHSHLNYCKKWKKHKALSCQQCKYKFCDNCIYTIDGKYYRCQRCIMGNWTNHLTFYFLNKYKN